MTRSAESTGPTIAAIASCSSCSGLPASTQFSARGWLMNRSLWKVVIVSRCATPGAITFLPPE